MSGLKSQADGTCFAAVLQVVQLSVMAHKLEAHELGILAMSRYIVYHQNITCKEQSTLYWVNALLSLLTGLLPIAIAWPIAYFYHIPQLTGLIMPISLSFLVPGTLSQYQAHFIKARKMVLLAKFSSIKYGIYPLGSQTINQLRTQADTLIVGKVMGMDMPGIYSLAKERVLWPLKLVSPVINRLALQRFAEKQHEPKQLQNVPEGNVSHHAVQQPDISGYWRFVTSDCSGTV